MNTKTAFNPFQHTTVFFMFGVLCSLLIVLYALNWNGPKVSHKILDFSSADFTDFIKVEIHTEEIKTIAPAPKPVEKTATESTTVINTQVIEVSNTKMTFDKFNIEAVDIKPIQNPVIITTTETNDKIYEVVEHALEFPGGLTAMYQWLSRNIIYPEYARNAQIEGIVYVSFVVNENGIIRDAKIARGIGGGCDEEVLRVLSLMPAWKAGMQGNSKVKVRYNLPVKFKLG
ncbi:MAG: TonB family protein [Bacteroidetes bacterium]|nr:TonB family protein [Bacteroidota bacterium]MBP7400661.1 TonB family protein [Chitinophagales bacterium]MBK8486246.1 TonB family protein [Bacteroidota bacterium]MBP8754404.1 TonB family protein [Chitinophagales bacterium]MBP9190289.1 TonB family protein [Chitinophagales bacterium]